MSFEDQIRKKVFLVLLNEILLYHIGTEEEDQYVCPCNRSLSTTNIPRKINMFVRTHTVRLCQPQTYPEMFFYIGSKPSNANPSKCNRNYSYTANRGNQRHKGPEYS